MKLDYGSNVEAIKSALKAASERVKQLEAENQQLKQQLQKLSTFSKKQRQRIKSQAGALRSAQTKVKKLRVSLKRAKSAARRTIRRVTSAPIIKSVTRRTREQYLEQMKPQFIERFIRRLHGAYPDFKTEWDDDVRRVLMSFSAMELDEKMANTLNMTSMYYESSSYSINRGATGRSVYESLVQYLPDLESE